MNDEIMQEVHAVKDALSAARTKDAVSLFDEIKREEAILYSLGAKLVQPPVGMTLSSTALQRMRAASR